MLVFALLGLGASSVSSYVHYQLLTRPSYESFCDVGATVSCTQAYLSQYGSFMGVPVAIAGIIFFAVVTLLLALGGRATSPARENTPGYIFLLSTIGLAFTLYLAWASYFQLKVFCILCAITYVSVIGLFIISGGATTYPMTTLPGRATRDLRTLIASPAALVALLAIIGGSVALLVAFPNEAAYAQEQTQPSAGPAYAPLPPKERQKIEEWWAVQPIVDIPIPKAAGTKVQIVKFSDYMCPSCRAAHNAFRQVLPKYEGQPVEFVMKHYPLEPECNPGLGGNHFGSCEAAVAYEMAKGTPNFVRLDDWLFENQTTLSRDVVRDAAAKFGIKDYDERYAAMIETVKTDAGLGKLLGVSSTPTIFINGRRIPGGGLPPAYYDAIIEMELKK